MGLLLSGGLRLRGGRFELFGCRRGRITSAGGAGGFAFDGGGRSSLLVFDADCKVGKVLEGALLVGADERGLLCVGCGRCRVRCVARVPLRSARVNPLAETTVPFRCREDGVELAGRCGRLLAAVEQLFDLGKVVPAEGCILWEAGGLEEGECCQAKREDVDR